MDYVTLRNEVRKYSTDGSYDFNGVVQIMLAALDNLREFAFDEELADIGYTLNPTQRAFLTRILDYAYGVAETQTRKDDD